MNFDDSICGAKDDAGYVFWDSYGRLLTARDSFLFEPSVLEAEFKATWTGITCAREELHAKRIFIEGDSITVIN